MTLKKLSGVALGLALFSASPSLAAETPAPDPVVALEAGTWDADIVFPSNEPGKPDGHAKGVQENEVRSGGMWMLNRFSVDGTPYQGTGIWGFDRETGRYKGVWVDNNDRQIRYDDGRWDAAARTMTWTADLAQPDGRHMRLLMTAEYKGDQRIFRSVALTRKGEVPLVAITFARRAEGVGK